MMENRRKLHRSVETFGIVNEESLFSMQVLKENEYRRVRALKTKTTPESGFLHWLGVNSIPVLREIILALKNKSFKSQKSQPKTQVEPAVSSEEEVHEEEEWDKEDVDEIESN